jgi:glycosyltransferase involved in cell wall biosynthesis
VKTAISSDARRAFTVFTPTYNRAHTLARVHASLLAQPAELFEWLVVDDGSTDGTEELLATLGAASAFPVRVIRQANAGKHSAHNRAIESAAGELTVILDSDDELLPGALEILWKAWESISAVERHRYSGVMGNSVDSTGEIVGAPFPRDEIDGHFLPMVANGTIVGDKIPCYRTDVLRAFPFAAEPAHEAIPEGTVWTRIGRDYLLRCVNQPVLRVHQSDGDQHSLMMKLRRPAFAAAGRRMYALEVLGESRGPMLRHPLFLLRHAVIVVRMSLHLGEGPGEQFRTLPNTISRLLWAAALPVGVFAWLVDRRRSKV